MNITDKAKEFIETAMKENGVTTLRFTFDGAGCCGPSYGINLGEAQENDVTETVNGIEIAIDPKVAEIVNRGPVRKMRIYNAKPIFLTIPPFLQR
ncbi:iron-sulfur cluster assembly accessory protein [Bacillus paranthracis]|uniref:adhesin n=1 Tax=Bacillus paranthracis TaxID=2026186 RepID=UPI0021CE74DA|nr:adhesin [Bacillus paranthracis]MCU5299147.1 adhesin [Bacillus paranthracis]